MASQVLWKRMNLQPKNSFGAALAPCPSFFCISGWPEAMNHSGHSCKQLGKYGTGIFPSFHQFNLAFLQVNAEVEL